MADNATKVKRSKFPATFFVANIMEIFERLAWYGFFALAALYITSPTSDGGLGFSEIQRGILLGIIPFILYLLPVITGALADRYGYKRTFLIAFTILTPAYYLLGQFKTFWTFFFAFLLVAIGSAVFKPVVVGTVARTTDETNKGIGFGIFYTIVNIGGFFGPLVAGYVRAISWNMVFIMSAIWISINFIPTIFLYKEPTTESDSTEKRSLKKVLSDAQEVLGNGRFALIVLPILILLMIAGGGWMTWKNMVIYSVGWLVINLVWNKLASKDDNAPWYKQKSKFGNVPFVLYLLILSGFWASFNQIFITMPGYIRDFVETRDLVQASAIFGQSFVNFIAMVNVESLADKIGEIVKTYGAVENAETAKLIFSELVHLKVRVPVEDIMATTSQLAATGVPSHEVLVATAQEWADKYRQVNPEYIINIDAGSIIIFQILVSWIIDRWKPFPVLVVGTIVAGFGIALGAVSTGSMAFGGFLAIFAIVIFAFGEMIASPKSQEYVARIAPNDKVALFMGYYFVSVALGNLFGGILSGWGYEKIALQMNNPQLMWIIFGCVGFLTAIALLAFNKTVVPKLEAQRMANNS